MVDNSSCINTSWASERQRMRDKDWYCQSKLVKPYTKSAKTSYTKNESVTNLYFIVH